MTDIKPLPRTDRTNRILVVAHQVARQFDHEYLCTESVMIAICMVRDCVGAFVLGELAPNIESKLRAVIQPGPPMVTMGRLPRTPRLKTALERAEAIAREWGHVAVGSEHLVCALAEDVQSVAGVLLQEAGATIAAIKATAKRYCGCAELGLTAEELTEPIRVSLIGPILRALMTGRWVRLDDGQFKVADFVATSAEPTFPLKECDSGGMMISLDGTLLRAAEALGRSRDNKHLSFPLRQLVDHIEELRSSDSDAAALSNLANFLSTWVKQ